MSAALQLQVIGLDDAELFAPFGDEVTGRAAWLAAMASGTNRYAGLSRASGPYRIRMRCEWSTRGTFRDVTEAHRQELTALCAELTTAAPTGYRASVLDDGRIVLEDGSLTFSPEDVDTEDGFVVALNLLDVDPRPALRRVRGLAEGRLVRETWFRVALAWFRDHDRAVDEALALRVPMFRVTRIRRAS